MLARCPCCGADTGAASIASRSWVIRAIGETIAYDYAHCDQCGHLFVSNPPTAAWLARYYETSETMRKDGGSDAIEATVYRDQAQLLPSIPGLRILEIGCDTGRFLDVLNANGAQTYFTEHSDRARAVLFKHRRHVEWTAAVGPMDVVILMHTLEHVAEPADWLRATMTETLADQGILVVEVPDWTRLDGSVDPLNVEHLHQFTAASIACLMQRAGLYIDSLNYARTPGYHTTPNRVLRVTAKKLPYLQRTATLRNVLDHSEIIFRRSVRAFLDGNPGIRVGLYAASWYAQDLLRTQTLAPHEIIGLYDSDQHKIGTSFFGLEVKCPTSIETDQLDVMIVLSSYESEIEASLRNRGFNKEIIPVSRLRN